VIPRSTRWATAPRFVRVFALFLFTAAVLIANDRSFAADKLRIAYVAPSVSLALPWVAKEGGMLAKHDLAAEILLITGSPRLVQSLIAGDVDVVFAGVTALTRARVRGADVAILGAAANLSSQKLIVSRNSKVRRVEDLKGAIIGVSQYGSEADTFTRNALAMAGLKPDKDVTILQLGGHPQVAAAMVAGKLDVGALAGPARAHGGANGRQAPHQRCRAEDPFAFRHLRHDSQLYSAQSNRRREAHPLLCRGNPFS
jgi:ABC-type nitrate/sulfonate/bicarbonate transport system substrate-binding protein